MALLHNPVLAICCLLMAQAQATKLDTRDRAITQVVTLLQEMLSQSKAEGDTERNSYAKYKCYCDTNEEEKNSEIASLQREINLLETKIEELLASTELLSKDVAQLKRDMAANVEARNEADLLRQQENQAFIATEGDLDSSIDTLRQAIETLAEVGADQTLSVAADHTQYMAGHNVSDVALAEFQTSLKHALVAASAFVSKTQVAAVDAFLQTPFTGTYTAQSGEVIGILKDMRKTLQADLARARDVEAKAVEAHGKFIQIKEEAHGKLSEAHQMKNGLLASNDGSLGMKRDELSTAQSDLSGAQSFLASLVEMCDAKRKQYEERVALRAKEGAAISEAISILNSDAAFATFGTVTATKDGAVGPTFLQHKEIRRHLGVAHDSARRKAEAFLQKAAGTEGSRLLTRIVSMLQANNPFTVVLEEIEKMKKLIAAEEQADDEQKLWCDNTRTETDSSISLKQSQIDGLNGNIDQLDTDINDPEQGLKVSIAQIETSIEENHNSQVSETEARRAENADFQKDVANLVEAETLLTKAIDVLHVYYSKITAEMSGSMLQKRDEPSPPATWDDKYNGQSTSGGTALDMLRFILTNTKAEETQAHQDELTAQHTYEDRMTELKEGYSGLQTSLASEKKSLAAKELELLEKQRSLASTEKEMKALEDLLEQIKPGCDFITTNIDARKTARISETQALQNAVDVLKGTPAYVEAIAAGHNETLGDCLSTCAGSEEHVDCKACLAGTSVPGYCAGHPSTDGCSI